MQTNIGLHAIYGYALACEKHKNFRAYLKSTSRFFQLAIKFIIYRLQN